MNRPVQDISPVSAIPGSGLNKGRPPARRSRLLGCRPAAPSTAIGWVNPIPALSQISICQRGRRSCFRPLRVSPTRMKNTLLIAHLGGSGRRAGHDPAQQQVTLPTRPAVFLLLGLARPHPPPRVYSPLILLKRARGSKPARRLRLPGMPRPNPGSPHRARKPDSGHARRRGRPPPGLGETRLDTG